MIQLTPCRVEFNGVEIKGITSVSYNLSPVQSIQIPLAPTSGTYTAEGTFTIEPDKWFELLRLFDHVALRRGRRWSVGTRLYRTLYGARAASRFWKLPVERRG